MLTLRRFLALCALFFWQGGFLFYSAVVIPIGLDVLRDEKFRQTWITERTTFVVQVTGVVALALLLWEWPGRRFRRRLRAGTWGVLALTLAGLFAIHAWMHQLHPPGAVEVTDRPAFGVAHYAYIGVGCAQMLAGLLYLLLSLLAWREEDRATNGQEGDMRTVKRA
jgi:hypothetical protein